MRDNCNWKFGSILDTIIDEKGFPGFGRACEESKAEEEREDDDKSFWHIVQININIEKFIFSHAKGTLKKNLYFFNFDYPCVISFNIYQKICLLFSSSLNSLFSFPFEVFKQVSTQVLQARNVKYPN